MIMMTCKCKKTTMTFKRLDASSFPNGWETDCCLEKEEVLEQDQEVIDHLVEMEKSVSISVSEPKLSEKSKIRRKKKK